jgi:hypothetical protein
MSVGHGLPKKTTFSTVCFLTVRDQCLNSKVGDGLIGLLVLKELPAELGALKCNEGVAEDQSIEMQVVELPAEIGALSALRKIEWWHCESLKDHPAELGALNDLQEINLIAGRWRIFVPGSVPSQRYRRSTYWTEWRATIIVL